MRREPETRAVIGKADCQNPLSDGGTQPAPGQWRPEREVWGDHGV